MKAASSSRDIGKVAAAGWITIIAGTATAIGISVITVVMTGIATTIGMDGTSDPRIAGAPAA
jgi:hypothetical protein